MIRTSSMRWLLVMSQIIISLSIFVGVRSESFISKKSRIQPQPPQRPKLVTDAIENDQPIYYFGLGSNMSRKKIENRGINGTKIEIQKMEAAVVPNYRLSFNMRGIPPIEPGMGSLEPIDSGSKSLLTYDRGECHGALIRLTPDNYEKVMRSEGVGLGKSDQGYEEIIVDAIPYGKSQKQSVKAVALRARDHVRLNYDPRPSVRYMTILKEGAKELGLLPCYQEFLQKHPVQILTRWQRKLAIYNILFMFSLSSLLKGYRGLNQFQSRLLFLFYSTEESSLKLTKIASDTMTSLILLPGAVFGVILYQIMHLLDKKPASVTRLFDLLDKD